MAKGDRLTIADLPMGELMELAQQVEDGEPLPPRIVRVREWAHWREPYPSARIDVQALTEGAVVFLMALPAGEGDPHAWIRALLAQGSIGKDRARIATSLLDIYFGMTGRAVQKPGPKPGSHHGVDDRTWREMMQKIDELRAINMPWEAIVARYPRWSERTLSGWLKEFRGKRGSGLTP